MQFYSFSCCTDGSSCSNKVKKYYSLRGIRERIQKWQNSHSRTRSTNPWSKCTLLDPSARSQKFWLLSKSCEKMYIKPSDKKSDIQTQLLFNICTIYASIFRDYVGARRFERRFKICELLGFVSSRIGWLAKGYFTVANVICFSLYLKNCLNSFTEAITR